MASLVKQLTELGKNRIQIINSYYSTMVQGHLSNEHARRPMTPPEHPDLGAFSDVGSQSFMELEGPFNKQDSFMSFGKQDPFKSAGPDAAVAYKLQVGDNIARCRKNEYLLNTLPHLQDNKEAVYGVLDAWVAWERKFPVVSLKRTLRQLERDQQWHRVIQVIKWLLSKGQCTTMRTYEQLIRALDMDHRAEEAHQFWMRKIGTDLRSVPWPFCLTMISVYYRNNMLGRLVKLFRRLEAFNRKPPEKKVVQQVANSYEMLGLLEEKNQVLEKYSYLFSDLYRRKPKKRRKALMMKRNKSEWGRSVAPGNAGGGLEVRSEA